jgi:hypothetical protein
MPTRTSGAIAAVESAAIDHQLMPCEPVWLATMTSRVLASVLVRSAAKKYSFQHNTLVEPPVVYADPRRPGTYLLLDGHLRVEVLKERGESEVFCLLATDDEAFTYNKRISRIAPIQEHFMIMRALERGVSEQRIARALNVDVPGSGRSVVCSTASAPKWSSC